MQMAIMHACVWQQESQMLKCEEELLVLCSKGVFVPVKRNDATRNII